MAKRTERSPASSQTEKPAPSTRLSSKRARRTPSASDLSPDSSSTSARGPVVQLSEITWTGWPSPEMLDAYEKVLPGSAARFVSIVEAEQRHRNECERLELDGKRAALKHSVVAHACGQLVGALGMIGALIMAMYAFQHGQPWPGAVIAGAVAGGIPNALSVLQRLTSSRQSTHREQAEDHSSE